MEMFVTKLPSNLTLWLITFVLNCVKLDTWLFFFFGWFWKQITCKPSSIT